MSDEQIREILIQRKKKARSEEQTEQQSSKQSEICSDGAV